jgi:RHS repeat-associated protein
LDGPAVDQVMASEAGAATTSETFTAGMVDWYLADNQGSVRDVVEYSSEAGAGVVVNHLVYDSPGQVTSQTNSAYAPTVMYAGMHLDPDTGLYYDNARWYDAVDAVCASQDPLGFGGGQTNTEEYCGNSPANYTDPSGCFLDFLDYDANKAAISNTQNYFNRPAQADPPLPPGSTAYYDSIGNGNGPLRIGNSISPRGQHFATGLLGNSGGSSVPCRKTDAVDRLSDFFAGLADTVSFGATRRARRGMGIDSEVEYHSWEYAGGQVAGVPVAIATTTANPAGWAAYATVGINGVQFAGNATGFVESAVNGDVNGMVGNALGMLGLAGRLGEAFSGDIPPPDFGGTCADAEPGAPNATTPKPPGWNDSWTFEPPSGEAEGSWRPWDPQGGEWRWHAPDKWHTQGHWDYNPWTEWNSPWQNVPHNPPPAGTP